MLCLLGLLSSCQDADQLSPQTEQQVATASPQEQVQLEQGIQAFCGDCHVVPQPESFPQDNWYEEVQRGYEFYFESGRRDLQPPVQLEVVDWYRQRAPKQFQLPPATATSDRSPVEFQVQGVSLPDIELPKPAAISFLSWDESDTAGLWVSDMQNGVVCKLTLDGQVLFRDDQSTHNPVSVRVCDLNQNAESDLLIADLGSFLPEDHDRGRVVWLPDYLSGPLSPRPLLDGVGRVADVRLADFDTDGDQDIVVAEFGWHRTGGIHVLWNRSDNSTIEFEAERLDARPGTIHVPVVDLNSDGRPDFLALISQEHERIVAFLKTEQGFEQQTLFVAPDPSYGSSGIEPVDLDQDGDLDILYTNGDTFDSNLVKPYHGVSWLENRGDLKFVERRLTQFPGVHRMLAGDLDRDGDLDLVASALLPQPSLEQIPPDQREALIWLEQTSPGTFLRHELQRGDPAFPALLLHDLNGDGFPDVVAGRFREVDHVRSPNIQLMWNGKPN